MITNKAGWTSWSGQFHLDIYIYNSVSDFDGGLVDRGIALNWQRQNLTSSLLISAVAGDRSAGSFPPSNWSIIIIIIIIDRSVIWERRASEEVGDEGKSSPRLVAWHLVPRSPNCCERQLSFIHLRIPSYLHPYVCVCVCVYAFHYSIQYMHI